MMTRLCHAHATRVWLSEGGGKLQVIEIPALRGAAVVRIGRRDEASKSPAHVWVLIAAFDSRTGCGGSMLLVHASHTPLAPDAPVARFKVGGIECFVVALDDGGPAFDAILGTFTVAGQRYGVLAELRPAFTPDLVRPAHPAGTRDRGARCCRLRQQSDRPPTPHQLPHGSRPPRQNLRKAWAAQADRIGGMDCGTPAVRLSGADCICSTGATPSIGKPSTSLPPGASMVMIEMRLADVGSQTSMAVIGVSG